LKKKKISEKVNSSFLKKGKKIHWRISSLGRERRRVNLI